MCMEYIKWECDSIYCTYISTMEKETTYHGICFRLRFNSCMCYINVLPLTYLTVSRTEVFCRRKTVFILSVSVSSYVGFEQHAKLRVSFVFVSLSLSPSVFPSPFPRQMRWSHLNIIHLSDSCVCLHMNVYCAML